MPLRRHAAALLLLAAGVGLACARGAPPDPARRAETLAAEGQLAEALREIEVALRRRPGDPLLLRAAGTLHARAGNHERAVAAFEAATRAAPRDASLWLARASAEAARGDADSAYVSARRALRLAPEDPTVLRGFAEAAERAGIGDEAAAARARLAGQPTPWP